MSRNLALTSLGYQGLSIDEYIDALQKRNVDVAVDVRLNAISRKPGFSKTKLSQALKDSGIEYLHLRELGSPKDNRAGFADTHSPQGTLARERYQNLLDSEDPIQAIAKIANRAKTSNVRACANRGTIVLRVVINRY